MKLVIFDLDQTLVDFLSVHNEATQKVFKKVFNIDAKLTDIDFTGRSLSENFHELAHVKRIPEDVFNGKVPQLLEIYESIFNQSLPPDSTKHILPGARELLEELSRTDHIVSLYTGNSKSMVNAVFEATKLGKYFKFCLYGT